MATNKNKLLSKREESRLIIEWQYGSIKKSRDKLIHAHQPLIKSTSANYARRGKFERDDIESEANLAFIDAIKKFDFKKKARLSVFARLSMRSAFSQYARDNMHNMRIATNLSDKKIFNGYRRFISERQTKRGSFEITEQDRLDAAAEFGVDIKVIHRMEPRIFGSDISLNSSSADQENDNGEQPRIRQLNAMSVEGDYKDVDAEIDQKYIFGVINNIIEKEFSRREKDIMAARMTGDMTPAKFEYLTNTYKITTERIRQIQRDCFCVLKENLKQLGINSMNMISFA